VQTPASAPGDSSGNNTPKDVPKGFQVEKSVSEKGYCKSVPHKEAGYCVGTEKSSFAVSSGMQTLQAPMLIVNICTLFNQYVSHSDFFQWIFWGLIYVRGNFV
jgi:hypothetical protein